MQATIKKATTSIQHNVLSGANMAAQFIHCNIDYEALELQTCYTLTLIVHAHTLVFPVIKVRCVPEVTFSLGVRVVKPHPLEPKCRVGQTLRIRVTKGRACPKRRATDGSSRT